MSHDSMSDGIFSGIVAANSNPAFAHRTVCGVNRTQAKKKGKKKSSWAEEGSWRGRRRWRTARIAKN